MGIKKNLIFVIGCSQSPLKVCRCCFQYMRFLLSCRKISKHRRCFKRWYDLITVLLSDLFITPRTKFTLFKKTSFFSFVLILWSDLSVLFAQQPAIRVQFFILDLTARLDQFFCLCMHRFCVEMQIFWGNIMIISIKSTES